MDLGSFAGLNLLSLEPQCSIYRLYYGYSKDQRHHTVVTAILAVQVRHFILKLLVVMLVVVASRWTANIG